jgi:deoxyuridine 5'-triphosphate nucleotidohydrolase
MSKRQRSQEVVSVSRIAEIAVEDPDFIPKYKTEEAAGCDILANITEPFYLQPKEMKLVNGGFCARLPKGTVGFICIRSGIALKNKVCLMNQPGILDSDYTMVCIFIISSLHYFYRLLGYYFIMLVIYPY